MTGPAPWTADFIGVGPGGADSYRAAIASVTAQLGALFEAATKPYSGAGPQDVDAGIARALASPLTAPVGPLSHAIAELMGLVAPHAIIVQHPRTIAHLHTPPLIASLAAEQIISALNQSMDSWDQSAAATFVEQHIITWLLRTFGMGADAEGNITSGGTQGNQMGLLLARDAAVARMSGESVQHDGLPPYASKLRVLCSDQAHFTVQKSCALLGLGARAVVTVPTDPNGVMLAALLEPKIAELRAEGLLPFAIVATAGTTDHGAVDPLAQIADIAQEHGLWLHVDAAYAGALILTRHRHRLNGIGRASSVAIDFHKLFYQAIGCGALLLSDRRHYDHMREHADYLNRADDPLPNLVETSLATTRRAEALKLFLSLRALGTERIGQMIEHTIDLTQAAAADVMARPALQLLAKPELTTVLFRFVGTVPPACVDAVNAGLRMSLLLSGDAVLGETRLGGAVALKLTLLNPCLTPATISDLLCLVVERGHAVAAEAGSALVQDAA
jgi:diaminobutyrate-2-oxoglutarate transaminase